RGGGALRSGEPGAPAGEVHESLPRVGVGGRTPGPAGDRGRPGSGPHRVSGGPPVVVDQSVRVPSGPTSVRRRAGRCSSRVRSGRPLRVVRGVGRRLSTGREFELRTGVFE